MGRMEPTFGGRPQAMTLGGLAVGRCGIAGPFAPVASVLAIPLRGCGLEFGVLARIIRQSVGRTEQTPFVPELRSLL